MRTHRVEVPPHPARKETAGPTRPPIEAGLSRRGCSLSGEKWITPAPGYADFFSFPHPGLAEGRHGPAGLFRMKVAGSARRSPARSVAARRA